MIRQFLIDMLGQYEPNTYTNALGDVVYHTGLASIDIVYLLSALLFFAVILIIYRVIYDMITYVVFGKSKRII